MLRCLSSYNAYCIFFYRYEAPHEIGPITVNDFVQFSVSDKEGNIVKDQVFTVTIEPSDNQKPIVEITQPVKVCKTKIIIFCYYFSIIHFF